MNQKLTPATAALLVLAPLLWAGNAVVGRIIYDLIPPVTLNFLRWTIALAILSVPARAIYRKGSGLWLQRKRYLLLGLLGIGLYNALQYMALHTSTPINVTLVGASMPIWMLAIGVVFFRTPVHGRQLAGAALSVLGVLVVLSHGDWGQVLRLRFVAGDLFMIVATIVWAFYSWLLAQPGDPAAIRENWAGFLTAQVVYGVGWSALMTAGEWTLTDAKIVWGWPVVLGLLYVSIGPAIVAFRAWGVGVQRVGPATAAFFANLMPLFAALLSSAFLGEAPRGYHAVAFALIVGGIVMSSRIRRPTGP
ncbi:EamA family transporter [Pusillimonas sp. TS35]|uniref:DMT family transporter n=1 Tax=Paracandidimonas lactea TaxID=2895524 RepID=UPI0013696D8F|nr:DMT family transporter [Paracandidimonas lactea]MYN14653.1 EamA family transporter [Pusillimonas sp. TS35]